MLQDFIENEIKKYPIDNFQYENEVTLMTSLLKNNSFRESGLNWFTRRLKRDEHNTQNDVQLQQLLSRLKKSKQLLEKYNLCIEALGFLKRTNPSFDQLCTKIYYERANILIKTENYAEAYDDLQLCKENGINNVCLSYRKGLCALRLQNVENLNQHVSELQKLFDESINASDEVKTDLEKYQTEFEKLKSKARELSLSDLKEKFDQSIKISESNKNEAKNILKHKNIKIEKHLNKGRYGIADETIIKDSPILTEQSFAFVPLKPAFTNNKLPSQPKTLDAFDCQNCANTNIIPYPCLKCCRAVYCSLKCLEEHTNIHELECEGYIMDLWFESGIGYLAYRTFLKGYYELKDILMEKLSKSSPEEVIKELLEESFNYYKDQYRLVLSLQAHLESTENNSIISYGMTSSILTLYLKHHTKFFETINTTNEIFKWEILIGSLIMRHFGQIICNAHAMSDLRFEYNGYAIPGFKNLDLLKLEKSGLSIRSDETFSGIFPFVSLLNHSCKPNIVNRFNRGFLTIAAKYEIQQTEEIYNNYGLNYLQLSTAHRKKVLQDQYHFSCNCTPCSASVDEFQEIQKLRCSTCSELLNAVFDMDTMDEPREVEITCPKCDSTMDLIPLRLEINFLYGCVDEINNPKRVQAMLTSIIYCFERLHPFHSFTYFYSKLFLINALPFLSEISEIVKIEIKKIVTNLLNTCEYLHGNDSIEYFLDKICIKKYLDDQSMDIISEAENLMSDHSHMILKTVCNLLN